MADLAYTIAGNVLDKLGSLAYQEVSLAWGMKQDLDKLKLITFTLQDVLLDAETKQENNPQLKNWLCHLKDVFHDAVDVLDEFECELLRRQVVKQYASFGRKVCRFFSRSNPLVYRFSVVHRVKEIRQQLDEIAKNMETFHLIKTQLNVQQSSLVLENRVMTHSFVNPSDKLRSIHVECTGDENDEVVRRPTKVNEIIKAKYVISIKTFGLKLSPGSFCHNFSLAIKLMRAAYAANGETRITHHLFDEMPMKNVVFFNVMIRSIVNNYQYDDGLLYIYPCVLKACSAFHYLWVGLQIHAAVVKIGLDRNLFVGNGLVFMLILSSYKRKTDGIHNTIQKYRVSLEN
ncbi:hypothetical protein F8388_022462 [Cannabis sativa]|uniref:Disease resistance N-terminal domain-containing protein n=1 Tax=Cannabis sativa TaxID=3483 RepID=A0A7J6EWS5_CANSA|nr:hypothetical protein F8388_022462 [Cannabis sativa]